jgi:hypothetical protein
LKDACHLQTLRARDKVSYYVRSTRERNYLGYTDYQNNSARSITLNSTDRFSYMRTALANHALRIRSCCRPQQAKRSSFAVHVTSARSCNDSTVSFFSGKTLSMHSIRKKKRSFTEMYCFSKMTQANSFTKINYEE